MGLTCRTCGFSGDHGEFKRLMGTRCDLKWRELPERERLWVVDPGHPIVRGCLGGQVRPRVAYPTARPRIGPARHHGERPPRWSHPNAGSRENSRQ